MPDRQFADPRLAAVYDALDPDRGDLDAYVAMTTEFGARCVVDIGCGTGSLAVLLAERGLEVVGVDPALASLDVARAKPQAERVRWIHGTAAELPDLRADLVVMTANVAQAIVDPANWSATLAAAARVLRPGGRLVFETRDPAAEGWREWNPLWSRAFADVPGVGPVESYVEVTAVELPLVSFTTTYRFGADGTVLTSDSTLRFRPRAEVEEHLRTQGFLLEDVRDAPDRPGRELVFVARIPQA